MTEMIPAAKPIIGDEEREAVDRVLRSGMIAGGPEVAAFESEFSELVQGRHSIAVNSGTSALHMAFLAAGIKSGDEVIVPSFTFAATANSVVLAGGTPVFADIEQDYFNMDPKAAEAAITPRTRALMPVHFRPNMIRRSPKRHKTPPSLPMRVSTLNVMSGSLNPISAHASKPIRNVPP
jgi:dTDP-4-amino-4,6-dideoxygalactose transaminase